MLRRNDFSNLVDQFIKDFLFFLAEHYQKDLPDFYRTESVEQFKKIIRHARTETEKFNAILAWCHQENNDIAFDGIDFKALKKNFIKNSYANLFEKFISQMHVNQQARIKENKKKWVTTKKIMDANTKNLTQQIKAVEEGRAEIIQSITSLLDSSAQLDQPFFSTLKERLILSLQRLSKLNEPIDCPIQTLPFLIDLHLDHRTKFINDFDKSIQAYEKNLAGEPWYRRLIGFLLPSRRNQKRVIADYKKMIDGENDINLRYESSIQWFEKVGSQYPDLIANQDIMRGFVDRYEQLQFESVSCIKNVLQDQLNQHIKYQQKTLTTHNQQIKRSYDLLKEMQEKAGLLQSQLDGFLKEIAEIETLPEQQALSSYLAFKRKLVDLLKNQSTDRAKLFFTQLQQVTSATSDREIQQLVQQYSDMKEDKEASVKVGEGVSAIIKHAKTAVVSGTDGCFMGMANARKLVSLFGDAKQQNEFKRMEEETARKSKQVDVQLEEKYVINLRGKIKTEKFLKKLLIWQTAYLKKDSPDAHQKHILDKYIFPAIQAASFYHQHGSGELKNFVAEIIKTMLMKKNKSVIAIDNDFSRLSWEQADILVSMYGTEGQKKSWKMTQQLKAPVSMAALSIESSRPMRMG